MSSLATLLVVVAFAWNVYTRAGYFGPALPVCLGSEVFVVVVGRSGSHWMLDREQQAKARSYARSQNL